MRRRDSSTLVMFILIGIFALGLLLGSLDTRSYQPNQPIGDTHAGNP